MEKTYKKFVIKKSEPKEPKTLKYNFVNKNLQEQPKKLYDRNNTNKSMNAQFHIIMVDFGDGLGSEKSGIRPALVVSNNTINFTSDNITVAPITSAEHKFDSEGKLNLLSTQVYLSEKYYKALNSPSIVQIEDIRTISKKRVIAHITNLTSQSKSLVVKALGELFNVEVTMNGTR